MQKRLLFQWQYITISTLLTILCFLAIFFIHSPFFGIPIGICFFLFFGNIIGQYLLPKETRAWQTTIGTITLWSIFITLLSGVYVLFQMNQTIFSFFLILIPISCSIIPSQSLPWTSILRNNTPQLKKLATFSTIMPLGILLGDAALFYKVYSIRAIDPPISPWSFLGPTFFLVFCITTALLIYYTFQTSNARRLLFLLPHTLLIFSVTFIVYAYGFGFDPFIHQASEQWILDHGVITPKQPYYIGQYMMTISWYYLTRLDIHLIDQGLVPLGSILLPIVSYAVFSRLGFRKKILPALVLLSLVPLPFFTLTTPNNLALLFAYITVLFLWYQTTHKSRLIYIVSSSLVALVTVIHAFIGIPLLLIFFGFIVFQTILVPREQPVSPQKKIVSSLIYISIISISLPLVFWLNGLRTGEHIGLQNPLLHLENIKQFFSIPHWYWLTPAPLSWDILYVYKLLLPLFIGLCIGAGIWFIKKTYQSIYTLFWIDSAIGLYLLAGIMVTTMRFPQVISYEQGVYAHRIIELTLILLLPFFTIALRELLLWIAPKRYSHIPLTTFLAVLVTISWYFLYPTRDPVSRYTGYSVRQADIEAVKSIHQKNNNTADYIVLTNQTVAAAALREFGFIKYLPTTEGEQYFYSIPTGGPLYAYFRKMVYEYPKKEWMLQAMDFAGVEKAYFVHTNYWYPAGELRDAAKIEADNWWAIGENPEKVWVFEYVR